MSIEFHNKEHTVNVSLEGDIVRFNNIRLVEALLSSIDNADLIVIDAKKLEKWDSSLVSALYRVSGKAEKRNIKIKWLNCPENIERLINLALAVDRKPVYKKGVCYGFLECVGEKGILFFESVKKAWAFLSDVGASLMRLAMDKAVMRKVDFEFAMEDCSYKAVGIISLVSFMVGLILAFVGAIQLKMFGAQIYVASLVTIAMTRIMGAIMAGIIMAGRTGASYAATIGTMQVNEEIDALRTFGFEVSDFLVLPRMLSLIITMPFLTILADIMGMIGGASVAVSMLDISPIQYWQYSVNAFALTNFLVGIFHGFVYGVIISCCGCYYGINCGRNADSVGLATTKAVVSAIVIMIVVTGFLTFVCEVMGI